MQRRHATLVEVAKHAGVSLATASRVLNGSTRQVGEQLRRRVIDSARELGYLANASAQTLARNTSTLVGLVVHDISDPYFSSIAAGVTRVAEEQGLVVVLGTTSREADRESALVSTLRSHRARAVVLAGSRTAHSEETDRLAAEIEAFRAQGGRVALVSQATLDADTVVPGNYSGAQSLALRLAELGHRRFAVLGGAPHLLTATDRIAGFRDGLTQAGVSLPDRAIVPGAFTRDGGYRATRELLAAGTNATCLFAVNDVMATGALAALREAGVRVPQDMSVAGFDDIPTVRDITPQLTTVRLPLERMGEQAARLALTDGPAKEPRVVHVEGDVVVRASTAAPPPN
ncbi:LacI family DNA-binding transcriptional regulator [Allonocardiopsis opalescens]|uniref:LacI family transcriptional regulator n=1 Tax=Allonocardiopsis opalescens TaxID=1144618 RepID=A0A2T0QAF0_9ACTN|nr:LacI family DNA-binding transcriptional regulator [Allonocardiopsis opalescens]PRY00859.1 LacI family transcriptional regulator [Allonocardiopsis opalescens]